MSTASIRVHIRETTRYTVGCARLEAPSTSKAVTCYVKDHVGYCFMTAKKCMHGDLASYERVVGSAMSPCPN